MSPTVAEVAVGLIAAVLVFMLAVRVFPVLIRRLADYFNRSVDESVERKHDNYED